MRSITINAGIVIGTAGVALAAPASADTLREALGRAYATNPTLSAERANVRASDEEVPIAKAAGRPDAQVSSGYTENFLNAEEAGIVAAAGEPGMVTVATNMAGRGTDIELSPRARAAGGLHVILTEFHETARIDRQLYGRAGRQGDPGSAESITAIDDDLYATFAPNAARTLRTAAGGRWPVTGRQPDLLRTLAQGAAERRNAASRRQTEVVEERLKTQMAFAGSD